LREVKSVSLFPSTSALRGAAFQFLRCFFHGSALSLSLVSVPLCGLTRPLVQRARPTLRAPGPCSTTMCRCASPSCSTAYLALALALALALYRCPSPHLMSPHLPLPCRCPRRTSRCRCPS
jgi:hypothetical protein